jgi:hypothetical protein
MSSFLMHVKPICKLLKVFPFIKNPTKYVYASFSDNFFIKAKGKKNEVLDAFCDLFITFNIRSIGDYSILACLEELENTKFRSRAY